MLATLIIAFVFQLAIFPGIVAQRPKQPDVLEKLNFWPKIIFYIFFIPSIAVWGLVTIILVLIDAIANTTALETLDETVTNFFIKK